jgi:hypothetical protein
VYVALLIQHATGMRHIMTSFMDKMAPQQFSTLPKKKKKGTIFENKMY